VVEAAEDISLDLEVVSPSAFPIDHSYAEEVAEIQEGNYWVVGLGIGAAVVAGLELVGVGKLLRRLSRGLRLRRGPSGGGLGRLRRRVEELGEGVQWLLRHPLWRGFSFGRGRRGVVRVGGC
jgi:hypothetical protein